MNIRCPDCGCPGYKKRWVGLKPSIHIEDWHVSCLKCGHEYIVRVGDDNVPYQIFDEPKETEEWPAKPCPFCGHVDDIEMPEHPMKGIDYWIECPKCGARGPKAAGPIMALGLWNGWCRRGRE